jgi:hypothetical protein
MAVLRSQAARKRAPPAEIQPVDDDTFDDGDADAGRSALSTACRALVMSAADDEREDLVHQIKRPRNCWSQGKRRNAAGCATHVL